MWWYKHCVDAHSDHFTVWVVQGSGVEVTVFTSSTSCKCIDTLDHVPVKFAHMNGHWKDYDKIVVCTHDQVTVKHCVYLSKS